MRKVPDLQYFRAYQGIEGWKELRDYQEYLGNLEFLDKGVNWASKETREFQEKRG